MLLHQGHAGLEEIGERIDRVHEIEAAGRKLGEIVRGTFQIAADNAAYRLIRDAGKRCLPLVNIWNIRIQAMPDNPVL